MRRPLSQRKCKHCQTFFAPDPRSAKRQRYCSQPACRQASKAASQRRWLRKPANREYFRGPLHVERVRQWRQAHPGYWRKGKPEAKGPLQDLCRSQAPQTERVTNGIVPPALQDLCLAQPALVVGLIATLTGSALQEDIADAIRRLQRKGQDILGTNATARR